MNEIEIQIPTYYIHQIGEQLTKKNIKVKDWLALSNVDESDISQVKNFISYTQFKSLINDAIRLSKQPDLGLLVGKTLGLTTHGMLGYAILASRCLRETIELFSRYLNTRTPLLRVELLVNEKELKVALHECYPLDSIKVPFIESAIFTLYNLLVQLAQNSAPITKICFPYVKPTYHQFYSESFNCTLEYDHQVASISLRQSELDKPLPMADKISLEQAKLICEQELEKLQNDELLSYRVRKYLLTFESQFPSLVSVSSYFCCSQRTLHRKLEKENTCFSSILKSVRNFRAVELLNNTSMTIQQISFALGYSDTANFRKAFKQWNGISPSHFRGKKLCN